MEQLLLRECVLNGVELERLVMETRETNVQLKRIADLLERLCLVGEENDAEPEPHH